MIEYLLKARGRASVRETIGKAYAAHTPTDRATLKSAAYGKLEMLKDLDLISVKDYEMLKGEINAVPVLPPLPRQELPVMNQQKAHAHAHDARCLDIGTGQPLTVSEFNALIASGYIKPIPRTETAPVMNTITTAWQQAEDSEGNEK